MTVQAPPPPFSREQISCVIAAYRGHAAAYRSKLTGDALAESRLSPEQLAQIQQALIALGFLNGEADGEFGTVTRAAIRKYQETNGFRQSDYLSMGQRRALLEGRTGLAVARSDSEGASAPANQINRAGRDVSQSDVAPPAMHDFAATQRVAGEFAQLMQVPTACQEVERERSRDCSAVFRCVQTLSSQVAAGVEYLKNNPAVHDALRDQDRQSRPGGYNLPGPYGSFASRLQTLANGLQELARRTPSEFRPSPARVPGSPFPPEMYCAVTWEQVSTRSLPAFHSYSAAGQDLMASVRDEYRLVELEYRELMAFNDRYTGVEAFERAYAAYHHAFQNDDIAGMMRGRPLMVKELEHARARKQLLTQQSAQISRYEQTLLDLATALDRESLTAFADQQMRVGLDELRHELQQLGQAAPAKRRDISTNLEIIGTRVRDTESAVRAARLEKTAVEQTRTSLVEDESTTRHIIDRAASEELKPAFDGQFVSAAHELINRLRELQSLDLPVLRERQEDVLAAKRKLEDLQKQVSDAQSKYDRAKRFDEMRRTVMQKASTTLSELAQTENQSKLSSDGLGIIAKLKGQFDALTGFDAIPLITRPNYSETLTAAEDTLDRIGNVKAQMGQVTEVTAALNKLNNKIDERGRRWLDASTSFELTKLKSQTKTLSAAKFPLSPEDHHQLAEAQTLLAQLGSSIDSRMDREEKRVLTRELPSRSGSWAFRFDTDKMTDEDRVQAVGYGEGSHAKYELNIVCRRASSEFLIRTFERAGTDPKRIPWNFDIPAPNKRIRLRIEFRSRLLGAIANARLWESRAGQT